MASLDITIPHQLSRQEALSRIQGLLQQLQKEQAGTVKNVSEKWNDTEGEFSFTAKGFDLAGKISVEENSVHINGQLPFALSFFKGMITDVIKNKAGEILSKA